MRPAADAALRASIADGDRLAAALPTWSVDEIAGYLTTGFWRDLGTVPRRFDLAFGEALQVDISALAPAGRALARNAMQAWAEVSALRFEIVTGAGADIVFDDAETGAAYTSWDRDGGTIDAARINIGGGWLDRYGTEAGSYGAQTYIHELGHALGLGHAGLYNGSASYAQDAHYANDSWQMSVMSYFSQSDNPAVDADFAYTLTPMLADIAAIRGLYGAPAATRAGDTVYGRNSTAAGTLADLYDQLLRGTATIVDTGGFDTLDLSADPHGQRIDLTPGAISDVRGRIGNLSIGPDTVLEAVLTGGGDDVILGNHAANLIDAGAGRDTIDGGAGTDVSVHAGTRQSVEVCREGAALEVHEADGSSGLLLRVETLRLGDGDVDVGQLLAALDLRDDPGAPVSIELALAGSAPLLSGSLRCPVGAAGDPGAALLADGADAFVFAPAPGAALPLPEAELAAPLPESVYDLA